MKKKNEKQDLAEAIRLLKQKQDMELQILRDQLQATYESIKPINLLKNALHEVVVSSEIRHNILNNLFGLTTGYLVSKVFPGTSQKPIKRMLGTVLQFAIATIAAKRSAGLKSITQQ